MGENQSSGVIVNTCVFGPIALVIVCLRLWFRISSRRFDASDVCIGLALILSVSQDALNLICYLDYGFGRHRADLPPSIATSTVPVKLIYANQIIFKLTTALCKTSLCLVYRHLFSKSAAPLIYHTRMVVNATLLFVIGAYGSAFLVSIFQCTPISKVWNPKQPGHCIDSTPFKNSTAFFNIFTSLLVIGIPLPALWKMKDKRPEVKQLLVLILLGLVHTGCALSRFVIMFYPDPQLAKDPQWGNSIPHALAMVEMNVGLIASALVVMRPAFQAFYSRAITPFMPVASTCPSSAQSSQQSGPEVPSYLMRSWERQLEREREKKRKTRRYNEISTFDFDTTFGADQGAISQLKPVVTSERKNNLVRMESEKPGDPFTSMKRHQSV